MTPRIATLGALTLVLAAAACGGTTVFEEDGGAGGAGGADTTTGAGASGPASSGPASSTAGTGSGPASAVSAGTGSAGGGVSTGTGPASSGGIAPCGAHDDCPQGTLCLFGTGECASACESDLCASCTAGTVCDACATSTSPDTLDCRAACLPTPAGRCDDDDPCLVDEVCVFATGTCMPSCENGACADPNMVCADCVTGSCCGCENCVSACLPLD